MVPPRTQPFADRIHARMEQLGTRLVIGLDPEPERFPDSLAHLSTEDRLVAFCDAALGAAESTAAAVKPQAAYFERHGWRGMRALQRVVEGAAARAIPVILDAKRGDIGSTASAYAAAYLGDDPETPGPFVDALTVNPYLGPDALEPFIARARDGRRGLFVLARTSNPGSARFQELCAAERPLYLHVAEAVREWGAGLRGECGYGPIGLVAGATFPAELAALRAAAPESILLLPGIGTQGGRVDAVTCAFDGRRGGALIASARAILYAYEEGALGTGWQDAIASAAARTRDDLERALAAR